MDKFLERYNLMKLIQKGINYMNSLFPPITIYSPLWPLSPPPNPPPPPTSISLYPLKIEIVVKNIPANKTPGLGGFIGKIYQKFKK